MIKEIEKLNNDASHLIELHKKTIEEKEQYKQALLDIKVLIQYYGNEGKILDIVNKALGSDKE